MTIQIRPYQVDDLPGVEALERRVQPYRPEDEDEVQAMFQRTRQAQMNRDLRWMKSPVLPERTIQEEFSAFWVAEFSHSTPDSTTADMAGIVGVQDFHPAEVIAASHPLVQGWLRRGKTAELRRLRVAPEVRRLGVGTRLCQVVMEWCEVEGYDLLMVNTTTPQATARLLYGKLGFREVGLSYIDCYELVWMELRL